MTSGGGNDCSTLNVCDKRAGETTEGTGDVKERDAHAITDRLSAGPTPC